MLCYRWSILCCAGLILISYSDGQCPSTSWTTPSSEWCSGPSESHVYPDLFMVTDLNDDVLAVTLLPQVNPGLVNHFLFKFVLSYRDDTHPNKWTYYKEKSGPDALYSIREFTGLTAVEMESAGPLPTLYLRTPVNCLAVRLHVTRLFPINGACMGADLLLSSCAVNPQTPTIYPNPTCASDEYLQYGRCKKSNVSSYEFVIDDSAKLAAEAQSLCLLRGGNLVSLHSADEMADMITQLKAETPFTRWVIGLERNDLGEYKYWMDDSEVDFTAWAVGEPILYPEVTPLTYLVLFLGELWESADSAQSAPFICRIDSKLSRRLVAGYYAVPLSYLSTSKYITEGSHSTHLRNSVINGRYGQEERFYLNTGSETYISDGGFKPVMGSPLHTRGPFMEVIFDMPMVIESVILKNTPNGPNPNKFIFKYSANQNIFTYTNSGTKMVVEIAAGTQYPVLAVFDPPIQSTLLSVHMVASDDTSTQLSWEVIGYKSESIEQTDMCELVDHGCSQLCYSTPGSYRCSCEDHHHLAPDGKTCIIDLACFETYERVGEACYRIDESQVTYSQALTTCANDGATLTSIHNPMQFDLLRRQLTGATRSTLNFFIGLRGTKLLKERWADATWLDVTYFHGQVPEVLPEPNVVYLDKDFYRAWNFAPESSTTAGFICKQLENFCAIPQLAGPFPAYYNITASSGSAQSIVFTSPDMGVFIHDLLGGESPIWVEVSFLEQLSITGFAFSSGDQLGPQVFYLYYKVDGGDYQPVLDKLGENPLVFTLSTPPSSLSYYWISPIVASAIRMEYTRPTTNRYGLNMEIFGCPVEDGVMAGHYCDTLGTYYRRLEAHTHEFHCIHSCRGYKIDSTVRCEATYWCGFSPCYNGAQCIEGYFKHFCDCAPTFLGSDCLAVELQGFQMIMSSANGVDTEDLYLAIFIEAGPPETLVYVDLGDDFHIDVRFNMLDSLANIATNHPEYDLTFLNSYNLNGHIGYVLGYRYQYMGLYNISAVIITYHLTFSSWTMVSVTSTNPCPTSLAISSLPDSYKNRELYLDTVDIRFQTEVNIQCPATSVLSRHWEWKLYVLKEDLPQPDSENLVSFTKTVTDQSSLSMLPKTLPPGTYRVEVHLNLTIAPSNFQVTASAYGYIVVIEPAVYVSIIGGTYRTVSQGRELHMEAIVSSFFPPEAISSHITDRFEWTCDMGPYRCDFVSTVWGGTYTDNKLPVTGKTFDIPANTLTAGKSYTFVVHLQQIGFGNFQTLTYTQNIEVLSDAVPDISIVCAINCGATVKSDEKLTLVTVCSTCALPTDLTYLWDFQAVSPSSTTQSLLWGMDTGTEATEDVLVIRPFVLDPGHYFLITVHGTSSGGLVAEADLMIQTTPVLTIGQCNVSPTSGTAMQTEFTVTCPGELSDKAYLYQVYMSVSSQDQWTLLAESYVSTINIGILPRGIMSGSTHLLMVTITSQSGISKSSYHYITVYGLGSSTEGALTNLILGTQLNDASALQKASMMGRNKDVLALMTAVVPELNTVTAGSETQMREKLLEALSDTETDDPSLLQPAALALDGLLQTDKSTVNDNMLDSAVNSSDSMAVHFTEVMNSATPLGGEKTAEYLLSGMSRLENVVRFQAEEIVKNSGKTASALQKSRQLTTQALAQKESVLTALAQHKYPGEESGRYSGEGTVMMVRRDTPTSLSGDPDVLDPETQVGGASIPFNIADVAGGTVTEVTVETMINSYSPFPWGDSESDKPVNQSSVSLGMVTKEQGRLNPTSLPTPVDVFLPINKNEGSHNWEGESSMLVYYDTKTGEVLQEMTLPLGLSIDALDGYSAVMKLDLSQSNVASTVVIKAGWPVESKEEFFSNKSTLVYLPHSESQNGTFQRDKNTIFLDSADYETILASNPPIANGSCGGTDDTCGTDPTVDSGPKFYIGVMPTPGQFIQTAGLGGVCSNNTCEMSVAQIIAKVSVVSAACVYWSEENNMWSAGECFITQLSTADQVHCQCNRLGIFSMSIFVMPNELDVLKDILLFVTYFENPLLISVVIFLWLLYVILIFWARFRDRRDDSLSGVTVLSDNLPGHKYMYLVGVSTGWGRSSGTSANVFMFIEGVRGRSLRHALCDEQRKQFCKGGDDWFLLTTEHSLGELESVTVWHDNSGPSPSWYLKSVTVQDVLTHDTWTFMYNGWLSLDRGSLRIMVTLPAFTPEEILKNSTYQFLAKWTHDMRDEHLWFSIFAKPLQSPFTRVQRLSCAVVLLLTAMLTNLMFYGIPTDDPEKEVTVEGFVISITSIVIGIETAIIMFPINFIIVQLFLNTRPRLRGFVNDNLKESRKTKESYPTLEENNSAGKTVNEDLEESKKTKEISLYWDENNSARKSVNKDLKESRKTEECSQKNENNSARKTTKAVRTSKGKSHKGKHTKFTEPSEHEEETIQINKDGQGNDINGVSAEKLTALNVDHKSAVEQREVEKENRSEKLRENSSKDAESEIVTKQRNKSSMGGTPSRLNSADDNTSADGTIESEATTEKSGGESRMIEDKPTSRDKDGSGKSTQNPALQRRLPWWCMYINWSLLICTALTCSFFVMLYGLRFGYAKSIEWTLSFFTSFLTSALVTEPCKVVLLALLLTMILKKSVTDKYQTVKDQAELKENLDNQRGEGFEQREIPVPQTFTQRALEAIRERVRMEWRIQELLKELALYFSFVIIVIIVAHGQKHVDTCYRATKSVQDMFIYGTYVNNTQPFTKVSTVEDMWEYISGTFLPNLYAIEQDINSPESYPPLCADGVTVPIGLARFRQIRKETEACMGVVASIPSALGPCKTLDSHASEDTANYSQSWSPAVTVHSLDHWTYQSAWQLKTIPYVGRYSSYSGGGYVAEIPNQDPDRDSLIKSLQDDSWIDDYTLAVFIEFTVYNPSKNLFSALMMSLEFIGTGEIIPFHQIFTTKLFHYGADFDVFVAVCEVLFIVETVSLVIYEIRRLWKLGRVEYFRDPWSYAEVLTVVLCIVTVVMYFQRVYFVTSAVQEMKDSNGERFVNFYTAGFWDYLLGYVLAFLVVLVIIKVFKLVRFNRKLTLFALTFRLSRGQIFIFTIMTFFYFMPFVHVGLLVFGSTLENYKNTIVTGLSLFDFALRNPDFLQLNSVSSYMGPIFFILFVFAIQFILINMLITVMIKSFKKARISIKDEKNEYEVVEYMWEQLVLAIGLHKKKKKRKVRKVKS